MRSSIGATIRKFIGVIAVSLILLAVLVSLPALKSYQPNIPKPTPTTVISAFTIGGEVSTPVQSSQDAFFIGRVINLAGEPVQGAKVYTSDAETKSDTKGQFRLPAGLVAQWVTVQHPDYISRTRASAPNFPVLIRLTPDDGQTIAIHFVGDTMFGRRFYDPNEDGDTSDGLLPLNAGASEHLALLSYVQPLLENADLTIINLETALSDQPYVDPTGPRPARFHPTKEFIFASHISAPVALKQAGVDIIDIGNNHLYDLLDQGVVDTFSALESAGFQPGAGFFGAGLTEAQAWQPAVAEFKGHTVAVLGCTSITYPFVNNALDKTAISYVVSDAEGKGGAARCEEETIRRQVANAKSKYDTVIFMVHGGSEYERAPSEFVVRMTSAARESGATLVINHTPHVVGGFDWNDSSLVAWTMGNFLFDQTVWSTFESYVLAVHLRDGKVIQAYIEPLMIEGFQPKGVTLDLAEYVARRAAGREPGPFVVENGAMNIDVAHLAKHYDLTLPLDQNMSTDAIYKLAEGWRVSDFSNWADLQLGQDILWVGSFEDQDVDEQPQDGALWDLEGANKYIGPDFAYEGTAGVRIQRGTQDEGDVVLAPIHRLPVTSGTQLSIIGKVRTGRLAQLNIQLSWYPDTRGGSASQTIFPIKIDADGTWALFRYDITVPVDTVAMGFFIKLSPPVSGLMSADFDNLRIIEWQNAPSTNNLLSNYILVKNGNEITVSKDVLPGGELGELDSVLQQVK